MKNERGVGKRQPDLHEKLIFNTESLRIEKETKPDLHNEKAMKSGSFKNSVGERKTETRKTQMSSRNGAHF